MAQKGSNSTKRRNFVKVAGAGALGLLAGCSGDGGDGGGSDGDGGGSDGTDGSDGSGSGDGESSDGGSTGGDLTQVNIVLAPAGFQGVMMDHITEDTNILTNEMESAGYTAKVQTSWEGAALFASGGPDFSTLSSLEAARLGVQRDIDMAVIAKVAPLYKGMWADEGGPYDTATTGSAQATIDKVVENGANVGVGSWAGGEIPAYQAAFDAAFGYTFTEDSEDFATVTADYSAISRLIVGGELGIGDTSPINGVARNLDEQGEPTLTQVFNCATVLQENGIGIPQLNALSTTQEFLESDRPGAEAYLGAWHAGMEWLFEDPLARVLEDTEEHFEQLAIENERQAEYLVDWGVNLSLDNDQPYNYRDQELTDEFIEQDRSFINRAVDLGAAPEGWEDRVEYVKIPQE